ncbi:hypothetical protein LINPERHAP2_LOCUS8478, partial [Linum perenne]
MRWLQSVLEVAESNRWRFPKWCSCEGPRRDIRVQSFFGKGGAALNVAEHCRNGKQVFVNIPAASSSGGWSPLLKTLISLLEVGPIPKEMSQEKASSRSFADIVKGPSFSFQGRCSQDSSGITVEAEGVENRLRFLERCICFRFSNKSPEAINWSNFRVWLQRNWGVDANARVSCLDDDLWLIEYRSKSEVDRIVSLKRDLYGSSKVLFDRWSKWAGYVDHDVSSCSLSSVRLKVCLLDQRDEVISLRYLGDSFSVRVCAEASRRPPVVGFGLDKVGKSRLERIKVWKPVNLESGGSSKIPPVGSPVPGGGDSSQPLFMLRNKAAKGSEFLSISQAAPPLSLCSEGSSYSSTIGSEVLVGQPAVVGQNSSGVEDSFFEARAMGPVKFAESESEGLELNGTLTQNFASKAGPFPGLRLREDLGLFVGSRKVSGCQEKASLGLLFSTSSLGQTLFSPSSLSGLQCSKERMELSLFRLSFGPSPSSSLKFTLPSPADVGESEVVLPDATVCSSLMTSVWEDEEAIYDSVRVVASALNLHLQGSAEKALDSVLVTASSVIRRQDCPVRPFPSSVVFSQISELEREALVRPFHEKE